MMVKEKTWSLGEVKRLLKQAQVPFDTASKLLGLTRDDLARLDNASILPFDMIQALGHNYGLKITGLRKPDSGVAEDGVQAAERLRQAREELGMSQSEFGESIGLTQAGVSKFEMNLIPLRKLVLLAIEHVYSIRGEWLIYGQEPKHLCQKSLNNDDLELLEISVKMKPEILKMWRQLGNCFINVQWDGNAERRKRRIGNKEG